MKCFECGGTYKVIHATLTYNGVAVPDADYHQCDKCGRILFSIATAAAYGKLRDEARKGKA